MGRNLLSVMESLIKSGGDKWGMAPGFVSSRVKSLLNVIGEAAEENPLSVKRIVFDFDGTIMHGGFTVVAADMVGINIFEVQQRVFNRGCKTRDKMSVVRLEIEAGLRQIDGKSYEEIFEKARHPYKHKPGKFFRITHGGAVPGMEEVLEELVKKYKVGILSADCENMIREFVEGELDIPQEDFEFIRSIKLHVDGNKPHRVIRTLKKGKLDIVNDNLLQEGKGKFLRRILGKKGNLHRKLAQTVCIGDGLTDVEAFREVPFSILTLPWTKLSPQRAFVHKKYLNRYILPDLAPRKRLRLDKKGNVVYLDKTAPEQIEGGIFVLYQNEVHMIPEIIEKIDGLLKSI